MFYQSKAFKEAERQRIERNKPTEHEEISPGRVYCPVVDRIRPWGMCAQEHGDYIPGIDDGEAPKGARE